MEKFRMFHIIQTERELSKQMIEKIIRDHRIIKKYLYTQCNDNSCKNWHILIQLDKNMVTNEQVARWFDVPVSYVKGLKGKGTIVSEIEDFMDKIVNLSTIESNANWKEKAFSNRRQENVESPENELDFCVHQIENGISVRELKEKHSSIFRFYKDTLYSKRLAYLSKILPPKMKTNFFFEGDNSFEESKDFAKRMYSTMNPCDAFFIVNENMFKEYDGQPVVVWKNISPSKLVSHFSGKENLISGLSGGGVYKNVKGIPVCNSINIFASKQTFSQFISDISPTGDTDKISSMFLFVSGKDRN